MDIKFLPEKYIIRRWTREARSSIVEDVSGRIIIENPKLDANRRYQVLARTLLKIAARAADFEEASVLVCDASNLLYKQVEEKIKNLTIASDDGVAPHATANLSSASSVDTSTQPTLTLKKKESKRNSGKRRHRWVEKLSGGKKGAENKIQKSNIEVPNSVCEEVQKIETIEELSLAGQEDQMSYTKMLMDASILDLSVFYSSEYLNQGAVENFSYVE